MSRSMIFAVGCAMATGVVSLTLVSLPSQAGSARPDSGVDLTQKRKQCFDPNFVRSFQSVDSHTMVITTDRNEAYELKLGGVCVGLDTSFQVGIRSRHGMGDVCGPFDADIVWGDGLRGLQSCPITSMRNLEGDEAAPYVRARRSATSDSRSE